MTDDARLLLSAHGAEQFAQDFPGEDLFEAFQLFHAVRFLAQRMHDASSLWLQADGLSATKFYYLALIYLRRKRRLTAGDVAVAARTTNGSVTTMLASLERDGLIERRTDPADTRCVIVTLTPKGTRIYRECARVRNARLETFTNALGLKKTRALLALLVEAGNALHVVSPESAHPQLLASRVAERQPSKASAPFYTLNSKHSIRGR